MKRYVFATIPVLFLLFGVGALLAHHAPSAIFDMKKPFMAKGTLTKVDWVNPHIVVYLDAKGANGATESWKFESNPPSWFKKVGVPRAEISKYVGTEVTIGGIRALDGSLYGYMVKFAAADGNTIELDLSGAGGEK